MWAKRKIVKVWLTLSICALIALTALEMYSHKPGCRACQTGVAYRFFRVNTSVVAINQDQRQIGLAVDHSRPLPAVLFTLRVDLPYA